MTKFSFAIDRGGTFTDIYVRRPDGTSRILKLLSEDQHYVDAPTEGIRRILEDELKIQLPKSQPIDAFPIESIRMGTTVATNALLERKGERVALAITKGFKDLLYIGNQSRPNLFELNISKPGVLYDEIVEVDERVILKIENCQMNLLKDEKIRRDRTTTGDTVFIWKAVDEDALAKDLSRIVEKGITSLAVLLIHSYKYEFPQHEIIVENLAKKLGFKNISLSSKIMPMIKAVPRGFTATADAYLTPVIQKYVTAFTSGFKNLDYKKLLFMQSDGGLAPIDSFFGSKAILSGPAGGVVGVAMTAYDVGSGQSVIGYDMGGTSTDISRYGGRFEHVFEATTANVTIQAPQLEIQTVAAGGGSRLFFRDGLFVVGPESVGANPGPACYKKGGELALTDANLILGRILVEYFPKIFGPGENEPLDYDSTLKIFESLTGIVNEFQKDTKSDKKFSVEETALGFVEVANESMCRPIRALTQAKGYDTSQHVLACFGGAGGQHACAIAKNLGIKAVFIHKYASVLSAYGIGLADVVHENLEPLHVKYKKENFGLFDKKMTELEAKGSQMLQSDGFITEDIVFEYYLNMRYDRTDCALMCTANGGQTAKSYHSPRHGDFFDSFLKSYQQEFGFTIPGRDVIVEDARVRAIGRTSFSDHYNKLDERLKINPKSPKILKTAKCFFKGGFRDTKVFDLETLSNDDLIDGPALLVEKNSTIVVEPGCQASITGKGDVIIRIISDDDAKEMDNNEEVDPIQLSIFSHRFMSIAEQMGRSLQRTAVSTNIKERLDFSCAIFSEDGGLVANAPHIPVHLGSMQETVQFQIEHTKTHLVPGDVLLCNDPNAGGTHLPDMTVITPVFYDSSKPVFFVANRGHHADIGGIVPGSMPPHSIRLEQEGACITSFKIVENGYFKENELKEMLMAPGKIKNCSGSRNVNDNISDFKAQIAANHKGVALLTELVKSYGLNVVQKYMKHIQDNADLTVREMLKEYGKCTLREIGFSKLHFLDRMDDGTPLMLNISIDIERGDATFDFNGTGCEVYGNTNAPKAVTQAAIIYCLRCLVGHDIPLNQGCLKPITVILPQNSVLNPSPQAAVVGGNVLTSQRLVDVILGAFGTCAASQGCMNNITFGDSDFGYYETVAGGAGAGEGFHGRHGVHSHMTNTRITDPEILEQRYPVVLKQFQLRPGSGGRGKWNGGDGVIREYLFRKNLTLSVLCERRTFSPYGLRGGVPGKKGVNLVRYESGRTVYIGGKASVEVSAKDTFVLKTPGGGGFGAVSNY